MLKRVLEHPRWPTEAKDRYAEEHRDGWTHYLDRLAGLFAPLAVERPDG